MINHQWFYNCLHNCFSTRIDRQQKLGKKRDKNKDEKAKHGIIQAASSFSMHFRIDDCALKCSILYLASSIFNWEKTESTALSDSSPITMESSASLSVESEGRRLTLGN